VGGGACIIRSGRVGAAVLGLLLLLLLREVML
jgi:hypothetical protein